MTAQGLLALDAASLAHFSWVDHPPVAKIMAALERRRAGAARFVGGCVRDSLRGEAPKDIDIASILKPEEAAAALAAAGLKSAPTGLEHGTVTGIADHVGVEITTLRADLATDGRRATVAFTDDWTIDAARRDFRLNAIYLTADRKLFDPVGGLADALAGRTRFIGAAEDRIREDYLRILRFFRFSARFAGGFDAEGLAACAALCEGIGSLSAERVGDEVSRILALARAPLAVDAMAATGVLAMVWPHPADRAALHRLKELDPAAPAPLGIAALWGDRSDGIDAALRLTNTDARRRKRALAAAAGLVPSLSERAARARLYRAGADAWRDGVLLAAAHEESDWQMLRTLPDRSPPPKFPFTGKDVIARGIAAGPAVAAILKTVEAAWIAEDFPRRERLDALLEEACWRRARPSPP